MTPRSKWIPQATPLQWLVLVVLCASDLAGISATVLGQRDLGRTLIGLGVVGLVPFAIWTRGTRAQTPYSDQHPN